MTINKAEPEKELFQRSGYMPGAADMNWSALPPFLRVLLSTDGTVTKSLEAYFWEPVEVKRSSQVELISADVKRLPALTAVALPSDELLWQRDVELVGAHSHCCYAVASSLVRYTLLPNALREALEKDRLGIGGVIRELGMETYRKVVAVGQNPPAPEPASAIWRTYCLYYEGQVLMHITETFDLKSF